MHNLIKLSLTLILASSVSYASKIVSVGGNITETIAALGHTDKLIGVDLSSAYPEEVKKLPNVGYWLRLPQEGILSLKPDLAIISSKAAPKKVVDALPNFGIKTHIIEDKPSIESAKLKIKTIAKILGEDKKAEKIVSRIETNIKKVQEEIKGKDKPRVLFVFSRGEGTVMAAGYKTSPAVMIELAGGKNIIEVPSYTKISPESILEMNPDVIITSSHGKDAGLSKSVVASTKAGKNNQVYNMDILLLTGFTVRVDKAMQDLSCMLNKNSLSFCGK